MAERMGKRVGWGVLAAVPVVLAGAPARALTFTANDLVISTVSGTSLDTASPITLQQFGLSANGTVATAAGSFALPQTGSGANSAISGEYGSASEGFLQQSVNGQYLTVVGYGVNAAAFNSAPVSTYGTAALGQTTSLANASVTTVPRVVALIGASGSVDTSTALTGVFNTNNPRSAATVDGSSFYVSGQGNGADATGGVFYAAKGATTATPINTSTPTNANPASQAATAGTETRDVQVVQTATGPQLYVSRDYAPSGTPNSSSDIRSLTNATGGLPTASAGLQATRIAPDVQSSKMNYGSINLTPALANGINNGRIGSFVYVSPEQFFFANATTLYIADSGSPKNGQPDSAGVGAGGLQKWVLMNGVWSMVYDLTDMLNLVDNAGANSATPTAPGVTGLFGLTGEVVGGNVELFATSYGLNELSPSYLYEVTDSLANQSSAAAAAEPFTQLYAAPSGTSIRGVAFAPVPEPASLGLLAGMLGLAGLVRRRRR